MYKQRTVKFAGAALLKPDELKMAQKPKTLVLGIGNTLLTDEGAGIRVIEALAAEIDAPSCEFLDGGRCSPGRLHDAPQSCASRVEPQRRGGALVVGLSVLR